MPLGENTDGMDSALEDYLCKEMLFMMIVVLRVSLQGHNNNHGKVKAQQLLLEFDPFWVIATGETRLGAN